MTRAQLATTLEMVKAAGQHASTSELQKMLAEKSIFVGEQSVRKYRRSVFGGRQHSTAIDRRHASFIRDARAVARLAREVGGMGQLKRIIAILEETSNGHTETPIPLPEEQKS